MNQDALTLAAIRDELAGLLTGGRVQRVVRPSELSLGLEIYTGERHHLLDPAGAGAAWHGIHESGMGRAGAGGAFDT